MKVSFTPKFHKGEIRSIYYERLLKKAARVGADDGLVRRIESLIYFDRIESFVGAKEIEGDLSNLPKELLSKRGSDSERLFVALSYDPSLEIDWALYFEDPEELVSPFAEELELCE